MYPINIPAPVTLVKKSLVNKLSLLLYSHTVTLVNTNDFVTSSLQTEPEALSKRPYVLH